MPPPPPPLNQPSEPTATKQPKDEVVKERKKDEEAAGAVDKEEEPCQNDADDDGEEEEEKEEREALVSDDGDKNWMLTMEDIQSLNLGELFLSTPKQIEVANRMLKQFGDGSKGLLLPQFLKYCSALVHPKLSFKVFMQRIRERDSKLKRASG